MATATVLIKAIETGLDENYYLQARVIRGYLSIGMEAALDDRVIQVSEIIDAGGNTVIETSAPADISLVISGLDRSQWAGLIGLELEFDEVKHQPVKSFIPLQPEVI